MCRNSQGFYGAAQRVQKFLAHQGENNEAEYVVFNSGVVMFKDGESGQWCPSALDKQHVFEAPTFEFLGWFDAPCAEGI